MSGVGFKLTDSRNQTRGRTQWGEGVTHTASGEGDLCGPGWIHFYDDANLAVLLNPIHANFQSPNLWRIEWRGKLAKDHGLKFGATEVTTIERVELPVYTREQKIAFGILCARFETKDKAWRRWAEDWLSGRDRSRASASNAAYVAYASSAAAYASDASNAAYAAYAAAHAAAHNPLPLKHLAKKALQYS